MRFRGLVFTLALGLVVCLAGTGWAQEQTGSIQGVVKDSSGAVVPGVTVEARSSQLVGVASAVTDSAGVYRFPALAPGVYTVTANLQGFAPGKVADISLALGQLLRVDLALGALRVTESVVVTGESPLIDVKQSASFATVSRTILDKIPKGRDFTSVVAVAPGAQNESYAGGIQIDGASGSENRFIVDGMDTTSMRSGTTGKTVLLDFVQEVQVKSSGYNAEFGGATGGVINVISKSGSNRFRGSAGAYYTGNMWRGPIRNSWRVNPNTDVGGNFNGDLEQVFGRDNDKWNNVNPVVDFGGPVFKDKLWFYAGFSQNRNDYSRTVKFVYGTPVGVERTFTWFDQQRYMNWNATTQFGSNLRLRVAGAHQWDTSRRSAPGFVSQGSTFSGLSGAQASLNGQSTTGPWTTSSWYADETRMQQSYVLNGSDYTNQLFSANLDWVVNPKLFINLTAGTLMYDTNQPADFAEMSTRYIYSASNMTYLPGEIPDSIRYASGWTSTARTSSLTNTALYKRLFANLNSTWYTNLGGQHTFKFGVRFERINNEMNTGSQYPNVNLYWNGTRTTAAGARVRGTYGYYRVRQSATFGEATSDNWSLWAQDSWTINSRLTINAGVRTEREQVPSYSGGAGIEFGFSQKFAPRLGFAYDVKGDGKWKAYGSYGVFFDMMKLSLPISSFGGDLWKDFFYTLDTYDYTKIKCNPEQTGGFTGACGPGTLIESYDYRFNSSIEDPRLTAYFGGAPRNTIDPNIKPYETREIVLGVDHELNSTTSVGVRFVNKWLKYAIEDVGVLLADPSGTIEVYFIANPGFGVAEVMLPDFPDKTTPPAQRDYTSIEFRLIKRLSNAWQVNASYLYSRLYGNFSGLASSDESGRTDPNVSRYYDAPYMSFNSTGNTINGRLYTDRPHQIKVQATYDFKFGTSVGVNAIYQSGVPVGLLASWQGYPVFVGERDSLGRTPFQQRYDLMIQHSFNIGKHTNVNVSANIDNAFDFKTVTDFNQTVNRDTFTESDETFFAGWDYKALVAKARAAGSNMRYNPLVADANGNPNTKPYSYMGRRAFRFNLKVSF